MPEKIICIGINYGNRNAEYKDGAEAPPKYPSVFMRTPGQPRRPPRADLGPPESEQLDYEGEIVLVIGKEAGGSRRERRAANTSRGSR